MPLDSIDCLNLLVSGSMAVFAIDRETGERVHLFVIKQGEPILPITSPSDAPWRLIAVSMEPCHVESSADDPDWKTIFALENWLAKIGEAVSQFCPTEAVQPVA